MRIEEKNSICVYFSEKDVNAIKSQPNGWQEDALELAAWEYLETQGYPVEELEFVEIEAYQPGGETRVIFHKSKEEDNKMRTIEEPYMGNVQVISESGESLTMSMKKFEGLTDSSFEYDETKPLAVVHVTDIEFEEIKESL